MLRQLRSTVGRAIRNFERARLEGVGHNFIDDVRSRLPKLEITTIFDVGAHIGITAIEFSDRFPSAAIYAFEPGTNNFARMKSNLVGKPDIRLHNIGFSSESGQARLLCEPEHPSMARLVADKDEKNTEIVELNTIDNFCNMNKIPKITIMKIDVEGHEISVLAGAKQMLSTGNISIIKLETAIDPDLTYHTQFFDVCAFMHPLGYRLFGFYDQWENPFTDKPMLRRFDAAFISPATQER